MFYMQKVKVKFIERSRDKHSNSKKKRNNQNFTRIYRYETNEFKNQDEAYRFFTSIYSNVGKVTLI